jgi:monoamine oxidase
METLQADFCVIGSGISGLTAAYRLHRAGASAIVLEAGDRIGGRIHTAWLSDGSVFEIGAEWISEPDLQPSINALMRDLEEDLGITFATAEQYIGGQNVFVDFDGSRGYYYEVPPEGDYESTGLPPIPAAAQAEIVAAFAALAYMADLVKVEARWTPIEFDAELSGGVAGTVDADHLTLHNWLEQNFEEPASKAMVSAMFRGTMGLEPDAISLLHVLFFLKSFGVDPTNVTGSQAGQAQHLRLPGGVGQIIDSIVKLLGADAFRTNSPVRDVQRFKDHVEVRSETATVTAKRVIVATSTAAVNFIRFHPPLPPDRAQLQQRMGLGSFWKIWLVYDTPFWRDKNLSGQVVSIRPGSYIANTRDSTLDPDGPGLLTCFIDANNARAFAHLSREERRETVLAELTHALGPEAGKLSETVTYPAVEPQNPAPDAYFEWNWSLPEFIRGDYAGTPGPGVYTAVGFGPAIQKAIGRIHWAGSDTSQECYGGMDGAVSTGDRTSAESLKAEQMSA